ncbi:cupin domain-containing protein [Curtobacterium luteum]|uniref:cupin domain-containing protein n=1 Tax=Curtobacterium luteum TaxID=33881 RepID=UPI00382E0B64
MAGTTGGAHVHNGPVFGSIEKGSVTFQLGTEAEVTLRAGDVFYEPAGVVVSKFDTTTEDVVFLGYFLLREGSAPEIEFTAHAQASGIGIRPRPRGAGGRACERPARVHLADLG